MDTITTTNQTNKYPQGIWHINENNENEASKTFNGKTITVPLTTEILEEMKRQIEADKIFKAFQQVSNENEHIIGYLNLILDDYINFLDQNNLMLLINKMKQIEVTDYIDSQNSFYVNQLRTSLEIQNIDNFYEILEQFQAHNAPYFAKLFSNQEKKL